MDSYSKTQPKAGKREVFQSANNLILDNGKTTSAEVKLDLRSKGYLVFPSDVSFWMNILSKEQNWIYSFNGHFRIYHFAPNPQWLDELLKLCAN